MKWDFHHNAELCEKNKMLHLPADFESEMKKILGAEYDDFVSALQGSPPTSIRLNPQKKLEGFETVDSVPWHPDGAYLEQRPIFTLDPSFHAGAYYVQEASSMLVFQAVRQHCDLNQKLNVLDLCGSPGGKSTLLASMISPDSFMLGNEVIKSRIPALKTNLTKWGLPNTSISNHDPSDFEPLKGFFDVVLVDAPCSGEGLFRKDHDATKEWSLEHTKLCAARQSRILENAVELVKPDGVLIYSTCTYNERENAGNIKELVERGGFEFLSIKMEKEWGVRECGFGYQCYPHRLRGEGFFISALRKIGTQMNEKKVKSAPLKNLKRLGKKQVSDFSDWLDTPERFEFFEKPNGNISAMLKSNIPEIERVGNVLSRRAFGLEIGQMKKENFIPSHSLALSTTLHPNCPSEELDENQAISFLKKENLILESKKMGWHLAKFKGLGLGWMKILPNRINNYLPMDWRIRMEANKKPPRNKRSGS